MRPLITSIYSVLIVATQQQLDHTPTESNFLLNKDGMHHISLQDVEKVLNSEAKYKTIQMDEPERTWHVTSVNELNRQLNSRYNSNDLLYTVLICSSEEGVSGYERRLRVEEFATNLSVIYNDVDRTCFIATVTNSYLVEPYWFDERRIAIHPLHPSMKLRNNLVETIEGNSNFEGFVVQLCQGYNDEKKSSVIDEILQNIWSSKVNNQLQEFGFENIYISSHIELSDRMSEKYCKKLFDSVSILSEDNNAEEFILTYKMDTNNIWAMTDCFLYLAATLTLEKAICAIEARTSISPLNIEAQWVTQNPGTENERWWFDSGLTGSGQVVAVGDSGLDLDNCYFWDSEPGFVRDGSVDMSRRKVVQYIPHASGDDTDIVSGHGTHVAGTIAAHKAVGGRVESSGYAEGIAKDAKIAFADMGKGNTCCTLSSIRKLFETGKDAGAKIHNSSWGSLENSYRWLAKEIDRYMYENPYFLSVVAAGNNGKNNQLYTVGDPGPTKNGITVGATNNMGDSKFVNQSGMDYLAEFSSRGPSSDGRIKPDLVAPGRVLLSTNAIPTEIGECDPFEKPIRGLMNAGEGVRWAQGTSMATPVVSGTASLIRQYFMDGFYPSGKKSEAKFVPTAALIKAVLVNGAQSLVGVGNWVDSTIPSAPYDFHQGFGRVSLITSLPLASKNRLQAKIVDGEFISNGEIKLLKFHVNKSNGCDISKISATLVWTDPPAEIGCTKCLLNDLDLSLSKVSSGSPVMFPNGLNKKDTINNVERVQMIAEHGQEVLVKVTGSNLVTDRQAYSLVVTGCIDDDFTKKTETPSVAPSSSISVTPTMNFDAGRLATSFDGSLYDEGIMFDVGAKRDVHIVSLSVHVGFKTENTIEIYTRKGTHRFYKRRPKAWKLVTSTKVIGRGLMVPSPLRELFSNSILIEQNQVRAFYITLVSSSNGMVSANEVSGGYNHITSSNSFVKLYQGTAVRYFCRGFYFPKRNFNGVLHFNIPLV